MEKENEVQQLEARHRHVQEAFETGLVSAMLGSLGKTREPIEQFSHWLLLAGGAIGSFLILNAEKIVPIISTKGFLYCGAFISASCIFGFLSKVLALQGQAAEKAKEAVKAEMNARLPAFHQEQTSLQEAAKALKISIPTGIRLDKIIQKYLAAFPRPIAWIVGRHLNKNKTNPQVEHILPMRILFWQGGLAFAQAASIVAFLISGLVFASLS